MQFIDPKIENYAVSMSSLPSALCKSLEAHTQEVEPMARMLIGNLEASFLGTLIRITGARRILEVGTFTGYSALAMAEHLPADGEIHTIDIHRIAYTSTYWDQSPHRNKIKMHCGPALSIIPELSGKFDFVFIDADKENYLNYFNMLEEKLNPRGVVVVDNVLWSGRALETKANLANDPASLAIQAFNEMLQTRKDLQKTLIPIRDGIFLITKL